MPCSGFLFDHKALAKVFRAKMLEGIKQPEKNIVSDRDGKVTFRYQNSKTKKWETCTLSGVEFLRKILLHILPKGFRRARNFGFLHPNSKLVKLVQLIKQVVVPPANQSNLQKKPCYFLMYQMMRHRNRS
jgi:hypothetical protein